MAIRYFSKLTPKTNVPLSNGGAVKFSTVDGLRGFFHTDDPYFIDQFLLCMRENRSAISEITEEEYRTEYLEKKSLETTLRNPWREEIARGSLTVVNPLVTLGPERVAAVVGVTKPPVGLAVTLAAPPADPAAPNGQPKPEAKVPFDVPVGQRKKAKPKV